MVPYRSATARIKRAVFRDIFDQGAAHVGVPGPGSTKLGGLDKRFSNDIPKIELSGPQHLRLSSTLPVLFTTEVDKIIPWFIERSIADKPTIILQC
ncbi:hypothetical protein BDV25DRAFT_142027 [Aspergillus avenaceus]|uniref:Uncharacterized protein n=1 Tax=Aspergillus avenaceus TaxID=36643 RepID=A0A5N6TPA4_ASPAV|nr:hypothetical protein BDV25DRAFT_142027 [Aspergillus avenaceus]